jgi:hypothetical protein
MKQKIVLEVVPWSIKEARGWTTENRKFIINQCKTSAVARSMPNSDDFCICLQQKNTKRTFQEFQKLPLSNKLRYIKILERVAMKLQLLELQLI